MIEKIEIQYFRCRNRLKRKIRRKKTHNYLGIFSKCPYKIQWHMKMPQYNHFICHFYCHFSVFSHILL